MVTTHVSGTGDTESIIETLLAAGEAIAEQLAETTPRGTYAVNDSGLEELVADKGYHSNELARKLAKWGIRTYIAEPELGLAHGKAERQNKAAVNANRRRI